MANNFIQKYVAEQRTGANLVGIQVDTQSQYLLDRGSGAAMLSALEEIGKKADEAKIQNEKQNLLLSAEEQDLQFKKEVLSDPLLYKDEERYRKALIQFETNRKEKESKILKSEYLTPDEKKLLVRRIRNNDELTLIEMMEQKNIVYTQQQTDNILANIERRISIASELNINDIGGAEQTIKDLTESVDEYQKLTLISDSQASIMLSDAIMRSEQGKFSNHINRILGSGLSLDQKRAKINNLLSVVKNDNLLTKMAESYASQIKYSKTDEEFKTSIEFFKSRINDVYENVGYTAQHHLERIEYNQAVQSRRAARENKSQKSFEDRLKKAAIKNDADGIITLLNNGTPYTTNEKLSDDFMLNKIYGKNMDNFGDPKDSSVGQFLSKDNIDGIKYDIGVYLENRKGASIYDVAENVIYPTINTLANGNKKAKIALLKDLGTKKILGLGVNVLINGENDPDYYQTSEVFKLGGDFNLEEPKDLKKYSFFGTAPQKKYWELIRDLGGGNDAKKALDSLVKGYLIYTESPYAEDFKRKNKDMIVEAFNEMLEDDEFINYVENNKSRIRQIKITPVQYRESKVSLENLNIKELYFENAKNNDMENFLIDEEFAF